MQRPAKYNGHCKAPNCLIDPTGHNVFKGQMIVWSRHQKGVVYHTECYNAFRGSDTSADTTVTVAVVPLPVQAQPIEPKEQPMPEAVSFDQKYLERATVQPIVPSNNPLADTLAQAIAPYLEGRLAGKVDEDTVTAIVDGKLNGLRTSLESTVLDIMSTLDRPTRIEVHSVRDDVVRDLGVQHAQFPTLLRLVESVPNVWMVGPAGSGKTTAGEKIAEALGLPFYFTGAIAEPYSLLGFKSATGEYQRTAFREAYEHGGVFLFDEIDSSEPIAVMPFNAALANGHCAFPDGVIKRHADCKVIASANTWGHGANDNYVGRLKMDGAFLDRFVKLPWMVDEKLENTVAGNATWVKRVQAIRRNVASKGIRVLVTPRASIYGAALLASGLDQTTVEELCLRNGMTSEQWDAVR